MPVSRLTAVSYTHLFGIFGLSTLPFLSIIVQYIDSITGFSSGNGYLTNKDVYKRQDGETGTCSGLPVILCLVEKL